ncbi:TPA: YhcH/YjgK/YiaL family protein [Kluyvera ascorbata]|nr:YhcH/YjgK/YiaL family protein [Kluyvera ascorbata]HDG1707890.1 YhcH/YjgK/YiaL family protein [Kluyvera ascorbata]
MIIGNLNALAMAGLPLAILQLLSRSDCSLEALIARDDGRWQPMNTSWFCTIGDTQTQPTNQRHTEYHQEWADIQVILSGRERIYASVQNAAQEDDEERKPDLFITHHARPGVAITLQTGDFALFMPREPHQALCMVETPEIVRKAVFKVPRDMLDA